MTEANFTATTYADTRGVYLGIAKNTTSFATFFTLDEINHLKEVIENATTG